MFKYFIFILKFVYLFYEINIKISTQMQRVRKVRRIQRPPRTTPNSQGPSIVRKPKNTNSKNPSRKVFVKPNDTRQKTVNRNKHLYYENKKNVSSVEPVWQGETVYIIGGGPSLKTFNWNSLAGKKTIAINKAFYAYPNADILYFTDGRFYSWYKDDIDLFKGKKYTVTPGTVKLDPGVNMLKRGQKLGLSKEKDTLCHGNNSGYAAINLAYLLGAKRIVLLGYDMGNDGKKSHFHEGYPTNAVSNSIYANNFMPAFETLYPILKNSGIEIYNANEKSRLNIFPKISLEKALSFK